jgi:hypothetical protein
MISIDRSDSRARHIHFKTSVYIPVAMHVPTTKCYRLVRPTQSNNDFTSMRPVQPKGLDPEVLYPASAAAVVRSRIVRLVVAPEHLARSTLLGFWVAVQVEEEGAHNLEAGQVAGGTDIRRPVADTLDVLVATLADRDTA